MGVLVMVAQLVASLSILVVLHELGHFIPAKLFKTKVEKFYLFFDPWFSLVKKKIGDTEYGIGWLPLGGYVKIAGMIDESMDLEQMKLPPKPWEFRSKPTWQRLIIMLGGVTVNFILGFLIFGLMLWAYGEKYLPTDNATYGIAVDSLGYNMGLRDGDKILEVGDLKFDRMNHGAAVRQIVLKGAANIKLERNGNQMSFPIDPALVGQLSSYKSSGLFGIRTPFVIHDVQKDPAKSSDLQKGDKVISVNGVSTAFYHEFAREIVKHAEKEVLLGYERDGRQSTVSLQLPQSKPDSKKKAPPMIGVQAESADFFFEYARQEFSLGQALPAGVRNGWEFIADQGRAFGQMFKGNIKPSESLGGFGTITKLFPREWQWERFWYVTAILSLILGFMNLLPIPALDGGHVMFLIYEMISGRKPSDKFMEYSTIVGFALVLGLVLYANGLDIWRWLTG